MTAAVHRIDFSEPSPPPDEAKRIVRLARQASVGLGSYTGSPSRVRVSRDGRSATAVVEEEQKRVQVGVGWYPTLPAKPPQESTAVEWVQARKAGPYAVGLEVSADVEWIAPEYRHLAVFGSFAHQFASVECVSVEDAVTWVRDKCLKKPLFRVTTDEYRAWQLRRVRYKGTADDDVNLSLFRAVEMFGTRYGKDLTESRLVSMGMSTRDAGDVVRAVGKLLVPSASK